MLRLRYRDKNIMGVDDSNISEKLARDCLFKKNIFNFITYYILFHIV